MKHNIMNRTYRAILAVMMCAVISLPLSARRTDDPGDRNLREVVEDAVSAKIRKAKENAQRKITKIDTVTAGTVIYSGKGTVNTNMEVDTTISDSGVCEMTDTAGTLTDFGVIEPDDMEAEMDWGNNVSESALSRLAGTLVTIFTVVAPAVASIIFFLFILGLVWIVSRSKAERERRQMEVMERAIEHNYQLPTEMADNVIRGYKRLSSGIVWTGIGLAICIFFVSVGATVVWPLGLIPMVVGVARLAVWFVYRRADKRHNANDRSEGGCGLPDDRNEDPMN